MRWDPETVAGWGKTVGWQGENLAEAVAVAMATSGCDDAYRAADPLGQQLDAIGLWGIQMEPTGSAWRLVNISSHFPGWRGPEQPRTYNFYDPLTNAGAAFGLWTAAGGWDWSPVGRAGTWRQYLEQGRAAAAHPKPPGDLPQHYVLHFAPPQLPDSWGQLGRLIREVVGDG